MKKQILLLVVCLSFSMTTALAQIVEEERSMSQGVKNGFMLEIPNADLKVVDKVWKKYAKQFEGKTKKDRKTDEWFTDDATVPGMGGSASIDLYASADQASGGVRFTTWYDKGDSYVNSYEYADQAAEAEKILMVFAIEVAKEMTRMELEEEEKRLKSLDNELKKLVRAKEGYEKEIEMAKERIAKAEANIETNIKDQENANQQISDQQEVIEKVKQKLSDLDN